MNEMRKKIENGLVRKLFPCQILKESRRAIYIE